MSRTAVDFLNKCINLQTERGKEYNTKDKQEERSFAAVATIFNTKTGKNITAAEVCLLLQDLKDVRQWSQDRFHADSVEDSVSYASLKAEELSKQYNEGRCTRNMPIDNTQYIKDKLEQCRGY